MSLVIETPPPILPQTRQIVLFVCLNLENLQDIFLKGASLISGPSAFLIFFTEDVNFVYGPRMHTKHSPPSRPSGCAAMH